MKYNAIIIIQILATDVFPQLNKILVTRLYQR